MELEFLTQIVLLFADEAFRHWFFWTSVILALLGVHPYRIFSGIVRKTKIVVNKDKKKNSCCDDDSCSC
jgi:hypothetical protein